MPYGGTTPSQDVKIERCVNDILAKGIKPRKAGQSAKSAAIAVCKARIMSNKDIFNDYFEGGDDKMIDKKYIEHLMKTGGFTYDEAVLKTKTRKALPASAFCGPDRTYPAHDLAHARNALARVSQFGNPALQARVRACVHRKFPNIGKPKESLPESFNESLSFPVIMESVNQEKRTVRVCALRACLSKNNRYYSPKIVESVSGTLKGKGSYADHDERDTKNLIGRIVSESYDKGRLFADIKISKAEGIAGQTWDKINDGTVTDVSIAADGKARPKKMDGKVVSEVTELEIHSVDFVTAGGVKGAKVMQVFEDIGNIPQLSEVKKVMENVKQLREEYPDLVAEIEEGLQTKVTEAEERATKAENKLIEKEVATHKETRISELSLSDKLKDVLRKRVNGKTVDEINESLKSEVDLLKQLGEAFDVKAEIKGIISSDKLNKDDNKNKEVKWTSKTIRENEDIPENLKGEAIKKLWNEGKDKMLEYLKSFNIDLTE